MSLTTANWIAIIGIAVPAILTIVGWAIFRKAKGSNKVRANQKSGAFSRGEQKININIGNKDE